MPETIEQLVRRIAVEEGVNPNLAVAMMRQESGGNPNAVGDNGHSVGLFQLHDQGMGAGMGQARYDPETNARTSLRSLAQTIRANPSVTDPGRLAAMSQRPYDPAGYARSVNAMLAGSPGAAHAGSGFNPNAPNANTGGGRGAGVAAPLAEGGAPVADQPTATPDPAAEAAAEARRKLQEWQSIAAVAQENIDRLTKEDPTGISNGAQVDQLSATLRRAQDQIDTYQAQLTKLAQTPKPVAPKSQIQNFGSAARPDWRAYNEATGEWEKMADQPAGTDPTGRSPEERAVDLQTAQTQLAIAQANLAKATSPAAQAQAQIDLQTAQVQLAQAQIALTKAQRPEVGQVNNEGVVTGYDPQTGAPRYTLDTRTEAQKAADQLKADLDAIKLAAAQRVQAAAARLQEKIDAGGSPTDADLSAFVTDFESALSTVTTQQQAARDKEAVRRNAADEELRKAAQGETSRSNRTNEQLRAREATETEGRNRADEALRRAQEEDVRLKAAQEIGSRNTGWQAFRAGGPVRPGGMSIPALPNVPGDPNESIGVRVLRQLGMWTDSLPAARGPASTSPLAGIFGGAPGAPGAPNPEMKARTPGLDKAQVPTAPVTPQTPQSGFVSPALPPAPIVTLPGSEEEIALNPRRRSAFIAPGLAA